jgi:hypothetical protein
MNEQMRDYRLKLKYDYATWTNQILKGRYDENRWKGYMLSFMFNHIPGSIEQKYTVMEDEIDRVYATLVRHAVHDGRSKAQRGKLPILYAFPDYPGTGAFRFELDDVKINDGLHYHGIILIRTDTKLGRGLKPFMQFSNKYFVKPGKSLRRLWIDDIEKGTTEGAVNYALKAIEWRIPESNRMVIRPLALGELPDRAHPSTLKREPRSA